MHRFATALICSVIATQPLAVEEQKKDSPWSGEAELGLIMTRGNTHTDATNAKARMQYDTEHWAHRLVLEYFKAEDDTTTIADRFAAAYRSTYKISERDYGFGSVRYEDDPFAGYDRRTSEILGYGRKLYTGPRFLWDVEAGVGARQTGNTDGTSSDEAIYRLATLLTWTISETSSLKEELSVEGGDENTYTESTTELKIRINAALAMKLTLSVKNNSDVPVGIKHTDTATAVTLVYDF